jgi:tetratricopeptide (TPR) repeat protein
MSNHIKLCLKLLFIILISTKISAQSFKSKTISTQKVFEKLVLAYGNAKIAPNLEIIKNGKNGAVYTTKNGPNIKIDEKMIDICYSLNEDSLNALSIILSHELSHYYNDHTFCSDYEFANPTLKKISFLNKIEKETQADSEGLWYSAIAGYQPFGIFNKILDKIYLAYNIPANNPGYPTKEERKKINLERQNKAGKLLPIFYAGYVLSQICEQEASIDCFNEVLRFFPSRENYNNKGAAQLKLALQKLPLPSIPFIYPIEFDGFSRLQSNTNATRSFEDTTEEVLQKLLIDAKQNFEKAINLDPTYIRAYTNLAIVYDILGNYDAAIGKLNELPKALPDSNNVNLIRGIAYYHNDQDKKAAQSFAKLPDNMDNIFGYNKQLYQIKDEMMATIIAFTTKWNSKKQNVEIPQNLKTDLEKSIPNFKNCKEIFVSDSLKVCSNNYGNELKIIVGNKIIFAKALSGNELRNGENGDFHLVRGNMSTEYWIICSNN